MGLLKGTWSFARYHITGKIPEQFNDFIDERLKQYAFSSLVGEVLEKNMGWTSLENVLDAEFTYAKYKCGEHLIFSLRSDRRPIPPSLLKLKVMEAEKKKLAEGDKKRLYRHEREQIKERMQLELQTKALNVPSFYELCWTPEKNSLIFGSLSPKVREDFEKYFKESFHLALLPFLPWESTPAGGKKDNIAEATSKDVSNQQLPVASATNNPIFWGREFLTWLWFKSEERGGIIYVPDKYEIELIFMQRLVLASGDGEYSETVVCQGLHSDMKEAREALLQGKKIKEARLRLTNDAAKWEFT
ncbi:MAG: recombination-associated protein RdgC, partial [Deltaproteobacteria bacterium]|nr:recombination-associated protein RdgC [Deltaproteobacteria bacterium]